MIKDAYRRIAEANALAEKKVIEQIEISKQETARIIKEKLNSVIELNNDTIENLKDVHDPYRHNRD